VRGQHGVPVEIVGEAVDVESAVEGIRRTAPDVVLLDVHLPGGGGRAVIESVRARQPGVVFLALSVSDAAEDVIAVIRAGARGYVTKTISSDDLAAALLRVRAGDAVFSPRLAGFVLDAFAGDLPAGFGSDPELDQITPREREVLRLLASRPSVLVTKDELMQAVWPDIAVTDDSLVQCITEIRKALGDDDEVVHHQGRARDTPARDRRAGIGYSVTRPHDGASTIVEHVHDSGRTK
jgi:DNA-binding NarL/FixJ family response regulator